MRKATYAALLSLLMAGAFLAGSWYNRRSLPGNRQTGERRVLYYTDPMHPAYRSDRPGIAPDCGMELVAVYADGGPADPPGGSVPTLPGSVHVSPQTQQFLGVRVSGVEKASGTRTLRLFGRVTPDEARVYRINAGTEGYIQDVSAVTTGSQVKKNELLATFSAPNSTMTIQTYILNLGAEDRFKRSAAQNSPEAQSLPAAAANIQQRTQQLQNLGMSAPQMEEIRRTREVPDSIKVLAPADGFVLARSVSPGQKFERGAEWYRIADLKRVWIVADVSDLDAQALRPGMRVEIQLPQRHKSLPARVSNVLPQFDTASGRLKVRLEADNPGYVLRPDMLVDVLASVTFPAMITVPAEAVLESGLTKTVFVEHGEGLFEPRQVETGTRFDDRVQIVKGLTPGERIVVSGNFLLGSETRLQAATMATSKPDGEQRPAGAGTMSAEAGSRHARDPACGMEIDRAKALAAGRTSTYRDQTYYFCSDSCKRNFDRDASGRLKEAAAPGPDQRPAPAAGKAPHAAVHGGRHG